MDNPEAASKNIRKIIGDITQSMQTKREELKKNITDLKELYNSQIKDSCEEHSKLLCLFEEINRDSQSLNTKKALIRKSLDKEDSEIQKLDSENQDFVLQLTDLETLNKSLKERKAEFDEKFKILQTKSRNMKERIQIKTKDQKSLNEAYKKYLGIEFLKLKENVIKIQFNNFGGDCYCILDFNNEECVSECFPDLNIEKLNYLFKERKSFYEFIKYLRNQFKQKM